MNKFVLKTILYVVALQVIVAFVWRGLGLFPNNYSRLSNEVNIAVQAYRMQQISKPKIVFLGGSGLALGLSSPMVSEHFKMPVCNTGTHAGMGLVYVNLYKKYISQGDIVIVVPEYEEYFGSYYLGDETVLRILSSNYPEGFKDLSLRQQLHLFKHVPQAFSDAYSVRKMKVIWGGVNSRDMMNEFGDLDNSRPAPFPVDSLRVSELEIKKRFQPKSVAVLKELSVYCEKCGAMLLIFPPACRNVNYECNAEKINAVWEKMKGMNLPLASTPQDYSFSDTLFCDPSPYHLTNCGVLFRTSKMIKDIEKATN